MLHNRYAVIELRHMSNPVSILSADEQELWALLAVLMIAAAEGQGAALPVIEF